MSFENEIKKIKGRFKSYTSELSSIDKSLQKLEDEGLCWGKPHYKDKKYLRVFYPQVNGVRENEYIGSNPEKVEKKLKAIERAEEYKKLTEERASIQAGLDDLLCKLRRVTQPF